MEIVKKIDQDGLVGEVKIRVPKYTERLRYVKECNFKLDGSGNAVLSTDQLDSVIKMIEFASKHVVSVDLKHGEKEFKTWEELECDPVCDSFISSFSGEILSGVSLGN